MKVNTMVAAFMLKPGVPAFLQNSQVVSLVRPVDNEQYLCRFPKDARQKKEEYKTVVANSRDLKPLNESVENLLDGSLFPTRTRRNELLVTADFVTCTQ